MAAASFARAERLNQLPPYLFAEIDRMRKEAQAKGADIIDLGVGDPDLPTYPHIVKRLQEAAADPSHHRYPSYAGMESFRQAVATWFQKRYGVTLDPNGEIISMLGSKEGIGHIPLAFVNPGDVVLVPDPGYPVYYSGTVLAGGHPVLIPLRRENRFLPDYSRIDPADLKKAKMLFLNYPNNPTAAVAPVEFLRESVEFARRNHLILCHDAAYNEMSYDGYKAPSLLQVEGGKEVGIEFHSFSKTFNMTGWRAAFAVGNREILSGLAAVKANLDSGLFEAVQEAGIAALLGPAEELEEVRRIYTGRRNVLVDGLQRAGFQVEKPQATFYLWVPLPQGVRSVEFCAHLLQEAAIVSTPGVGFGSYGEGFIRFTLTVSEERLQEAVERIRKLRI
ncbi:MAG: LL-diaminopimelate aminotransferase [Candidatus Tectomicrobia bacterium]|uniref:Aminotransferase n=1 Tax=Tectimicrobiota bacterium TaxID=2528274 RepID=A0A932GR23_UNCTE|nr:LL-diaminopimelate aminotransferase [Candidatus Tectomicrobia bacterium]